MSGCFRRTSSRMGNSKIRFRSHRCIGSRRAIPWCVPFFPDYVKKFRESPFDANEPHLPRLRLKPPLCKTTVSMRNLLMPSPQNFARRVLAFRILHPLAIHAFAHISFAMTAEPLSPVEVPHLPLTKSYRSPKNTKACASYHEPISLSGLCGTQNVKYPRFL